MSLATAPAGIMMRLNKVYDYLPKDEERTSEQAEIARIVQETGKDLCTLGLRMLEEE